MRWPRLATARHWGAGIARFPVLSPMSSISVLDEAAYPVGSRSAMPGEPTAMQPVHQPDRNIISGWAAMVQHYFVAALIPLVASSRATEQKPQRSDAIAFFQFPAVLSQNADDLVAFHSNLDLCHCLLVR
jgi:YidC periplasmic domain